MEKLEFIQKHLLNCLQGLDYYQIDTAINLASYTYDRICHTLKLEKEVIKEVEKIINE